MKIRFTEIPNGTEYKIGQEVDFVGPVEGTYARKYINRGWAVEVRDDPVPRPAPPKPAERAPPSRASATSQRTPAAAAQPASPPASATS